MYKRTDNNQKKLVERIRLTKDQIAKSAVAQLKANGARVRKVHNVSAYIKRRGQVEKGWPDIQGYSRTGVAVLCEVKTLNDKLSAEQIDRLNDLDKCGGISLLAVQVGTQVILVQWAERLIYGGKETIGDVIKLIS